MELDAFDFVAAVAEAHDDAVIGLGGDGQLARQGFFLDDERMVARGGEGIRQLAENILAVVMDLAGFAMKQLRSANDFAAECGADGLMAEAHTKDGKLSREALDQLHGNARLLRGAGAGRDDDALGLAPGNFFDGNFVFAMHFDLATQLAAILRNVVGEGIVVVEKQNHNRLAHRLSKPKRDFSAQKARGEEAVSGRKKRGSRNDGLCQLFRLASANSRAVTSAFDLLTLSRYSPSGVESATMPPPAWT